MIDVGCTCGVREDVPENQVTKNWLCPSCGKTTHLVCAEPLEEGAGSGDFDASLTILEGPARAGERFLIGGVVDIQVGKLPGKQIVLPGQMVSRNHFLLKRVDFGPSRWQLVDANSTYGTFVNGERITEHDLVHGDRITAGDFELLFEGDTSMPQVPAENMAMAEGSFGVSHYQQSQQAQAAGSSAHPAGSDAGHKFSLFGWLRKH